MGGGGREGEELKTRDEPKVEIQERGEIFFFYRPKVDKDEAHSADDVQRLYIVLRPESGESSVEEKQSPDSGKEGVKEGLQKDDGNDEGGHGSQEVNIEKEALMRFIVMGRKSLPDPTHKSRPYWGFVEMVTTNPEDVKLALKGEEYDTATRGHRHNSPARALGEGVYRILRHNSGKKTHTHLIYKLEFPRVPSAHSDHEKNEPQEALNIENEASFLIQIKNPDNKSSQFRGLKNKRRAAFPAHLQGRFGQLRYLPADPPDFLNYEGCEFLLISASDDIEDELGLELKTTVDQDQEGSSSHDNVEDVHECYSCSDLVKTFGETASVTPLFKGTWV